MTRDIDELSLNAWPSLQTQFYDGWILRFADGYTRRSNSVYPVYESSIPLDEKIGFCYKTYSSLNLPALFRISSLGSDQELDRRLEEKGYERSGDAALRILDMDGYGCMEAQNVTVESRFSDKWLDGFFFCSNITNEKDRSAAKRILDNVLGEVIVVSKQIDGRVVGCGYGAVERGHVGIFDIAVHKDYRANGYGKSIMEGILGEAACKQVGTAYLQVLVGNIPAEKLYDKLGFHELYRYWYRKLE